MKTFPLRVLAPERTFFDGACTSLTVPSIDGMYGLMAQHEDIVLAIVPGKLTLRDSDGVEQIAAVSEGVLKMEHGEALVLVDTIERPEEIDLRRAGLTAYSHGVYYALGDAMGFFGYSVAAPEVRKRRMRELK